MYNLRNRSFLKEIDFTTGELQHLLTLAAALKTVKYAGTEVPRLKGKEIALIFEKTSTRTRSAFEVAAYDQGAHVTYLDPAGSQMGHKESIADTARVLGRMYDGIEYRGAAHSAIEELAALRGRARLQRPDRRVASDPDAGRLPHDGRGQPQALRRDRVLLHGRRAQQHGALAARHGRHHGLRRPHLRTQGPLAAGGRPGDRRGARRADRRAHHADRRPRRGAARLGFRLHRRVGLDGRAEGHMGGARAPAHPLPGQPGGDGHDREPAARSSCTACRRSTTRTRRWAGRS